MEERTFFIKPCPCCGSTAEITHSPVWGGYISVMVAVRCLNPKCGLRMDKRGANAFEAAERAVNAWNKREAEA